MAAEPAGTAARSGEKPEEKREDGGDRSEDTVSEGGGDGGVRADGE